MITIIVNVEVVPNMIWEFKEATKKSQEETFKEKGCFRYEILRNIDEDDKFILIEEYENVEAINFHKETSHFKEWEKIVNPITTRTSTKNFKI